MTIPDFALLKSEKSHWVGGKLLPRHLSKQDDTPTGNGRWGKLKERTEGGVMLVHKDGAFGVVCPLGRCKHLSITLGLLELQCFDHAFHGSMSQDIRLNTATINSLVKLQLQTEPRTRDDSAPTTATPPHHLRHRASTTILTRQPGRKKKPNDICSCSCYHDHDIWWEQASEPLRN